jgi:hypothetical protein
MLPQSTFPPRSNNTIFRVFQSNNTSPPEQAQEGLRLHRHRHHHLPLLRQLAPAGGAAAVFAELNRGEDVTKGLRKVDKSEMTHKNPALRAGSVVPASTSSSAG